MKKKEKNTPRGVYLSSSVLGELQRIATKETGGNLHAVMQYGIKFFIREYNAGKVKIKKTVRVSLDI